MQKLQHKTALIVGGASGIGAGIASLFAQEGATTIIADKDINKGQAVAQSLENSRFVEVDVTSADAVHRLFETIQQTAPILHIVVNSAGMDGDRAETAQSEPANWDEVTATNLSGVYYITRAALPLLEQQGNAAILNIASVCGIKGTKNLGAYAASKAGVVHLTKTVALEYAARGVRVNALCPSVVHTPLLDHYLQSHPTYTLETLEQFNPMPGLIPIEAVAKAALFLCSSDSSYITGVALPLDGGYTA